MSAVPSMWSRFLHRQARYRWQWSYSAFSLGLLLLLLYLGFWQLARAAEKDNIETQVKSLQLSPAKSLSELKLNQQVNYRPVLLTGRYLKQPQFLLDNQVVLGKVGFDVISVFNDQSGLQILVNRGFVPGARTRAILPEFATPVALVSIEGFISKPLGEQFMLAQTAITRAEKQIIQSVDITAMRRDLEQNFYPHLVRLNAGYPGVFTPHWQAVNMKSSKHRGYALQWFSMALALLVFYWLVSTREIGNRDE